MNTKSIKLQRTCVGCFQKFDQDDLLAITRLKSNIVVVNVDHAQVGRSVYVCKKPSCLRKAEHRKGKNALEYGLKVVIQDSIWKELHSIIEKNS